MPELANSSLRRIVSLKKVFPPSIKMSPLSKCGSSCWIVASVAGPACTINIMRRGTSIESTNSSIENVAFRLRSGCSVTTASVFDPVRLYKATE